MTEFLNDVEVAAVEAFFNNEGLRESVKKVMLACVYNNGVLKPGKNADPLTNFAIAFVHQNPAATNEQVGYKLRAQYEGLMKIQEAFDFMATIKTKVEKQEPKKNQAR